MAQAQSIGHYRLDEVLGVGTFATVWRATDLLADRQVAVKVLADNWSRNHDITRRFRAEARLLLTAESPRIIRGFQVGETDQGIPYLVMALADRGTLEKRIDQRAAAGLHFDATETASILREIALGLADLHAIGHLHRDLKPSNVLIRSSPSPASIPGLEQGERLCLGDFGLARQIDQSAFTLVAGSPGYVAPEQASGLSEMLTPAADVFPLGVIATEMLAGSSGPSPTTMSEAAARKPRPSKTLEQAGVDLPGGLTDLLDRMTATDPARRPSIHEVIDALGQVPGVSSPSWPPMSPSLAPIAPPVARRSRSRAIVVGVAATTVAAALVGGVLLLGGGDDPNDDAIGTTEVVTTPTPTDGSGLPAVTIAWSENRLPLPPSAVLTDEQTDQGSDANVFLKVDDVVDFYQGLRSGWELDGDVERTGASATITLRSPTTEAVVVITPTAETATDRMSHVQVTQTRR